MAPRLLWLSLETARTASGDPFHSGEPPPHPTLPSHCNRCGGPATAPPAAAAGGQSRAEPAFAANLIALAVRYIRDRLRPFRDLLGDPTSALGLLEASTSSIQGGPPSAERIQTGRSIRPPFLSVSQTGGRVLPEESWKRVTEPPFTPPHTTHAAPSPCPTAPTTPIRSLSVPVARRTPRAGQRSLTFAKQCERQCCRAREQVVN